MRRHPVLRPCRLGGGLLICRYRLAVSQRATAWLEGLDGSPVLKGVGASAGTSRDGDWCRTGKLSVVFLSRVPDLRSRTWRYSDLWPPVHGVSIR